MSAWPGKYVIGLTGNIATGKSVIRRMLEHLGAYGIDADSLAHRAMAKGAPGYDPIVEYFGRWILDEDGQINRSRLGQIVFSHPEALQQLESILHPLVRQAVDILVRRAKQDVIVVEAIKLLEGGLAKSCDTIWVSSATHRTQMKRLLAKRGMTGEDARRRIDAQGSQQDKLAAADKVIDNNGAFENTWLQVANAWKTIRRPKGARPAGEVAEKGLNVTRARPGQAAEIAAFISRLSAGKLKMSRNDIMAAFGEKAFMLLREGRELVGLVGWQVENLITRTADFYLEHDFPLDKAVHVLMEAVETASRELQSEASLLFLPAGLANHENAWKPLGYEPRTIEELNIRAWQEAARESQVDGTVMLFKQLRVDRVLRPI